MNKYKCRIDHLNRNVRYDVSDKSILYIHTFANIRSIFDRYLRIESMCYSNSKVARHFFIKKQIYTWDGVCIGTILEYNKKRVYTILLNSNKFKLQVGDKVYILDESYKAEVLDDLLPEIYDVSKNVKYIKKLKKPV